MPDEAILDLRRTDPIAGRLEHVVGAALVPEIAIVVGDRDVTGATPVATELPARSLGIAEVFEEEHRIGRAVRRASIHRYFARLAGRAFVAFVVDHRDPVSR